MEKQTKPLKDFMGYGQDLGLHFSGEEVKEVRKDIWAHRLSMDVLGGKFAAAESTSIPAEFDCSRIRSVPQHEEFLELFVPRMTSLAS